MAKVVKFLLSPTLSAKKIPKHQKSPGVVPRDPVVKLFREKSCTTVDCLHILVIRY